MSDSPFLAAGGKQDDEVTLARAAQASLGVAGDGKGRTRRDRAWEISDALTTAGLSHKIVVGVADKFMPRERYSVNVTPLLVYEATDITMLQRLADSLECDIAFCAGSFTFVERS